MFSKSRSSRLDGYIAAGQFTAPASREEPGDHWLDGALRTVPLPEGFMQRVSLLADGAANSWGRDDGLAGQPIARDRRPRT
jgi:hypothetical protein